jgi:hypothetical protein
MFELRLVPERTLSDLELCGAGIFGWNNQAAVYKEFWQ